MLELTTTSNSETSSQTRYKLHNVILLV